MLVPPAEPAVPAVRLHCLALPSDGSQLGLDYLTAFHDTGVGVRAVPIGPVYLMSGPWSKVIALFFGPLPGEKYINVVVAPPGLSLGFAYGAAAVSPGAGAIDGPVQIPGIPAAKGGETVYQPKTALSGLYTVGVPNIAVTSSHPQAPDPNEVRALQQYDFVLVPTDQDAKTLKLIGVDAFHVPPDPGQLARLLGTLL